MIAMTDRLFGPADSTLILETEAGGYDCIDSPWYCGAIMTKITRET